MTVDEKRQLRATLLLEIEEAEHDLAAIKESARRYLLDVRDVVRTVESTLDKMERMQVPNLGPDPVDEMRKNQRLRNNFSFDAALAVIDQLRDASAKLHDLRRRKAEFGIGA